MKLSEYGIPRMMILGQVKGLKKEITTTIDKRNRIEELLGAEALKGLFMEINGVGCNFKEWLKGSVLSRHFIDIISRLSLPELFRSFFRSFLSSGRSSGKKSTSYTSSLTSQYTSNTTSLTSNTTATWLWY